jgi:hypothetical protein
MKPQHKPVHLKASDLILYILSILSNVKLRES